MEDSDNILASKPSKLRKAIFRLAQKNKYLPNKLIVLEEKEGMFHSLLDSILFIRCTFKYRDRAEIISDILSSIRNSR
ncbi:MAG: hypothetical protein QW840_01120, partial [Candidatus Bathyarchaeia archaeon]